MKKLIAIIVTTLLILSLMSVNIFADDFTIGGEKGTEANDFTGGNASKDVIISITGEVVNVYAVDIEFGDMEFAYSTGMKWDPTDYTYKPQEGSVAWTSTSNTIKVRNHSDLPIVYNVAAEGLVSTYGPLNINVTNGEDVQVGASGVGTTSETAPNATTTITVTGTPNVSAATKVKLGSVKVTVSKVVAP